MLTPGLNRWGQILLHFGASKNQGSARHLDLLCDRMTARVVGALTMSAFLVRQVTIY